MHRCWEEGIAVRGHPFFSDAGGRHFHHHPGPGMIFSFLVLEKHSRAFFP